SRQQFLVAGSSFHGVHGIAFNKDDQLFAGSVFGQTLYHVQIDSGEVDRVIEPPAGIAFAKDGRLFVSEAVQGDALYEIDARNVDKPDFKPFARKDLRRVADK